MLDALLDDYVEKDMGSAELIAAGHDPGLVARVIRLVDLAEYKRRQYPPGPEDQPEELRPGPAAADYQPLAGDAAGLAIDITRRGGCAKAVGAGGCGRQPLS